MKTGPGRIFFLAALMLGCIGTAHAGGFGSGKVEIEHVGFGPGLVFFYTTVHTGGPSCNDYRGRWVLNLNTPEGKGQYAFLLAAEAMGKEVRVWGTGTCDVYSNTESVAAVGSVVDYSQHP